MLNANAINAARDYSFLTGEINGPHLTWDEIPTVPPQQPIWNQP